MERDLGAHLEATLRGVVIGERWPKSGVEVVVTVLEGEEEGWWGDEINAEGGSVRGWGTMTLLAACITIASAALVEAGIDCVDLITGGVAALVTTPSSSSLQTLSSGRQSRLQNSGAATQTQIILDPSPIEHPQTGVGAIQAACVVGYLASRDEVTEVWMKADIGGGGGHADDLVEGAVRAAVAARGVLSEVVREGAKGKFLAGINGNGSTSGAGEGDVKMGG